MARRVVARRMSVRAGCMAAMGVFCGAGVGHAAVITWLDTSPTLPGSPVPNNSNYFVPGVGLVNVSYAIPANFTQGRLIQPAFQNGNVPGYTWGAHELLATTNQTPGTAPLTPDNWSVTYTFPSTLPANSVFVSVGGLGATTTFGGGASVATVQQNGTFLGDFNNGGGPWGATLFTPGAGFFTMQNSVTGAGGVDPHWNTELGVVQINDSVSSITIRLSQLPGDGVGVNVGFVPAPASVLALGGLVAMRRRRVG
ncbi:MAG: hypothetical protein RBS39_06745 [Phycisphaerales bacterium]|nr:hypothetical protein [Phycisphaerales bacterium]